MTMKERYINPFTDFGFKKIFGSEVNKDRSVFYASFPIQQQAQKGSWDFRLKPVYMVGILDFIFDEDQASHDVVHHEVKLLDRSTGQVFYNKLTFIYLELPKFRKSVDELITDFDKWCYLLRNLPELTDRPQRLQEKVFSKIFEIAEIAKYSPAEAAAYEDSLKVYRDLKNVIDTAYDEGKAEGKLEVAQRLVESGMSVEQAAEMAGVPVALLQSS